MIAYYYYIHTFNLFHQLIFYHTYKLISGCILSNRCMSAANIGTITYYFLHVLFFSLSVLKVMCLQSYNLSNSFFKRRNLMWKEALTKPLNLLIVQCQNLRY